MSKLNIGFWQAVSKILRHQPWFVSQFPIKFRIQFKGLVFSIRALHGQTPACLSQLPLPYITCMCLRSSDQDLMVDPPCRLKTKGECAFEVVAPKFWNSFPLDPLNFLFLLPFIVKHFVLSALESRCIIELYLLTVGEYLKYTHICIGTTNLMMCTDCEVRSFSPISLWYLWISLYFLT